MYLNIILTLIFVVLSIIAWNSASGKKLQMMEYYEQKQYNRDTNEEVIRLHWLILHKIDQINMR